MDIKDIQHLIKFVAKSGAHEVKLEMEDIKITIKTGPDQTFNENSGMVQQVQPMPVLAQAPVPPVASAPEIVAAPVQSEEDNLITIKSPIIGTFYRKATPDKPSFVENSGMVQQVQPMPVLAQAPVPPVASAPEVVAAPVQSEEDNLITIKSPIIGTFYRKATPDKPSFVEIGQVIKEGDVLCVIEAMKLFNEIESELSGTIVKILVDDASPVEFDQPLFVINPS